MKNSRRFVLNAAYVAAILLSLLAPAFAQQEMDPTWYDPWAQPNAHGTRAAATKANKPRKIKLVSQDRPHNKKALQSEPIERAALVRR